jgi:hypothetical protein
MSQISDASRECFDHAHPPQGKVGWANSCLRCTALAIGLVLGSLFMDAQAETWIEESGGSYVLAPYQLTCTAVPLSPAEV